MLHYQHSKLQENTPPKNRLKRAFTLTELIIAIAIGSTLIMITYSVLGQSLKTLNETTIAGTMDNYAHRIQKMIRTELINASYIDVAATGRDKVVDDIYYANNDGILYGIVFDNTTGNLSIQFNPRTSSESIVKSIFSSKGSNGVTLVDLKWDISKYKTMEKIAGSKAVSGNKYQKNNSNKDDTIYDSPDNSKEEYCLVSYSLTLRKEYPNGDEPLTKTYHFREVLENAL